MEIIGLPSGTVLNINDEQFQKIINDIEFKQYVDNNKISSWTIDDRKIGKILNLTDPYFKYRKYNPYLYEWLKNNNLSKLFYDNLEKNKEKNKNYKHETSLSVNYDKIFQSSFDLDETIEGGDFWRLKNFQWIEYMEGVKDRIKNRTIEKSIDLLGKLNPHFYEFMKKKKAWKEWIDTFKYKKDIPLILMTDSPHKLFDINLRRYKKWNDYYEEYKNEQYKNNYKNEEGYEFYIKSESPKLYSFLKRKNILNDFLSNKYTISRLNFKNEYEIIYKIFDITVDDDIKLEWAMINRDYSVYEKYIPLLYNFLNKFDEKTTDRYFYNKEISKKLGMITDNATQQDKVDMSKLLKNPFYMNFSFSEKWKKYIETEISDTIISEDSRLKDFMKNSDLFSLYLNNINISKTGIKDVPMKIDEDFFKKSFAWDDSLEGFDFWNNVERSWDNYLNNNKTNLNNNINNKYKVYKNDWEDFSHLLKLNGYRWGNRKHIDTSNPFDKYPKNRYLFFKLENKRVEFYYTVGNQNDYTVFKTI